MIGIEFKFFNREELIFTAEQVFLITPRYHDIMNVDNIVRVSGDKKKMTLISIDRKLLIDFDSWEESDKKRLYNYLENTLSISIPQD